MITYELENNIAVLTMDDGKMNVVNVAFVDAMNGALDKAEADNAKAIVLAGRAGAFSAGFDLKAFAGSPEMAKAQLHGGFELLLRLLGFPRPVIAACTGHGIGMGAFLLMTCDHRVGAEGAFKYSLPESRIGMEIGTFLIMLAKSRISSKYLTRMAVLSEDFDVQTAMHAGVLDEITSPETVLSRAVEIAERVSALPQVFHHNKLGIKATELEGMRIALDALRT